MATAEELLMTTAGEDEVTEEILVADLNTRVISIPTSIAILGVESDDDVKRLQFKIPRYYGEFDLSEFDVRVNFQNARSKGDVYPVDDVAVTDDDHITFSWLVDRVAFQYAGNVNFSLCLKLYDDAGTVIKELNTTFATLPVLQGLETEKAVVEQNPSAFDQIMYRLYAIEAVSGLGQNGYYTVINVTENDEGVLFSLVNQDGEIIANVKHGYVPVKGVDYWTEEDVTTITADLNAQVNKLIPKFHTITLSTDWADGTQTVSVPGVTADSMIFVVPHPETANSTAYTNYGIQCYEQGTDYLKFRCTIAPPTTIQVNVGVYGSNTDSESGSFTVVDDGNGNVTLM